MTTLTYDKIVELTAQNWDPDDMPTLDMLERENDATLSSEAKRQVAFALGQIDIAILLREEWPDGVELDEEKRAIFWADVRKSLGIDDTIGEHTFVVTVSGCSRSQAEQVLNERIGYDEDYGFGYTIDWSHESSRVSPEQAETIAQRVLDDLDLGVSAGEGTPKTPADLTHALQSGWIDGETVMNMIRAAIQMRA